MGYKPDPGGHFRSDAHRHILGHLPTPDDGLAYRHHALHARTNDLLESPEHTLAVLRELQHDGHAEEIDGLWFQTRAGFDTLTGPIADEPPEVGTPEHDAIVAAGLVAPAFVAPGHPQVADRPKPVTPTAASQRPGRTS